MIYRKSIICYIFYDHGINIKQYEIFAEDMIRVFVHNVKLLILIVITRNILYIHISMITNYAKPVIYYKEYSEIMGLHMWHHALVSLKLSLQYFNPQIYYNFVTFYH